MLDNFKHTKLYVYSTDKAVTKMTEDRQTDRQITHTKSKFKTTSQHNNKYTASQKIRQVFVITSPNVDLFTDFF